ncbi:uncharacterized protein LTHEOB_13054 [Lasiodiplodia theobromae]|uniref:uncharacterized protein n=1 Tax=Lasiodiplodia theobromae TaxID=45133 RepID=UPI0015C33071|nr:uncharacterized protein LTHEOB_13054 [Lasiodiplodia theobromae]KAF4545516.1 hypothetical protein LTHEOB_13054 [Lasiodiplodia theobromae]
MKFAAAITLSALAASAMAAAIADPKANPVIDAVVDERDAAAAAPAEEAPAYVSVSAGKDKRDAAEAAPAYVWASCGKVKRDADPEAWVSCGRKQ